MSVNPGKMHVWNVYSWSAQDDRIWTLSTYLIQLLKAAALLFAALRLLLGVLTVAARRTGAFSGFQDRGRVTVVALSVSVAAVSIPLAVPVPFAMSSMVVHLRGFVSIRSCAGPLVVLVGLTAFFVLALMVASLARRTGCT